MKILFATKEALKFALCDNRVNFRVVLSLTLQLSLCTATNVTGKWEVGGIPFYW
jgi:hypothetical protein